jgi:hypothetical protein
LVEQLCTGAAEWGMDPARGSGGAACRSAPGGEQAWLAARSRERRIAELISDGDIGANLVALKRTWWL